MRSATRKRVGKDKAYLEFIAGLPCACCELSSGLQTTRTECAHIGDRGLSQRAPDITAVPLCVPHHREGRMSAHVLGKRFWEHWGIDRDGIIAELQRRYAEELQ